MSLRSESADVEFTVNTPGYAIIKRELEEEFKRHYEKLRTAPGRNIFRVRGRLDGLEYALNLPDLIKDRGEADNS